MAKIIDSSAVKRARFKRDSERVVNAIVQEIQELGFVLAESNYDESLSAELDIYLEQIQSEMEEARSQWLSTSASRRVGNGNAGADDPVDERE